jgi:hypothetical protein
VTARLCAIALAMPCPVALPLVCSSGGVSPGSGAQPKGPTRSHARANPFSGRGMWIWELGSSNGGDLGQIVARARRNGISTLMVKSGDGTSFWSQFSPALVRTLHAAHLRVCAWQYVYGDHPVAEAQVGAEAVRVGANCLLIDAESEYQGRYVAAQTYLQRLRRLIGARFPVALAGFPWIDYHPSFPYSVFLGPGGAQYDVPQMYWRDIGVSPDQVYAHTYSWNELYQRPIFPLGQLYGSPAARQVLRFRQLSRVYGSGGVSWFDWQDAGPRQFYAMSRRATPLRDYLPYTTPPTLAEHAAGDVVVWAQEHLVAAGEQVRIDGRFGPQTLAAVQSFQGGHGLPVSGQLDPPTWAALLRYRPVAVRWQRRGHRQVAVAATARRGRGGTAGPLLEPVPSSASLPARGYEIPRDLGAGRPPA